MSGDSFNSTPLGLCGNCGEPSEAHEKERVQHEGGRWSYNYLCP